MSYPEALPTSALCVIEGCDWRGGSVCLRCGSRLRCACGRFVREDRIDEHVKTCDVVAAFNMACPICEGGFGPACASHG